MGRQAPREDGREGIISFREAAKKYGILLGQFVIVIPVSFTSDIK